MAAIVVQHDRQRFAIDISEFDAKTYTVDDEHGKLLIWDAEDRIIATFAPGGWSGVYFADAVTTQQGPAV